MVAGLSHMSVMGDAWFNSKIEVGSLIVDKHLSVHDLICSVLRVYYSIDRDTVVP